MNDFINADAQLLAVSVDSVHTHKAFSEHIGIEYPLVSDFNREIVRAYGVAYEDRGGLRHVAKRAAFVIDQEQIVRYRWISDDPSALPDVAAIVQAVRTLRNDA